MLLRMYLRWAQRHRFGTEILDQLEGEEAGLKSVTVAIDGRSAYGYLRAERGVHRLVRISPFDSQKRRHTTFALVEVLPEVEDDDGGGRDPGRRTARSTRSARRARAASTSTRPTRPSGITHIPTGIVAQSQNERSQHQNREFAMKVLKARLLERRIEERERELAAIRGEHVEAGWGNQIRSLRSAPVPDGQGPPHQLRDKRHDGGARRRPRRVHAGRTRARGDRRRPAQHRLSNF